MEYQDTISDEELDVKYFGGNRGVYDFRNSLMHRHRVDGPAWIDGRGNMSFVQNNAPHRLDGPASGNEYHNFIFYVNGVSIANFTTHDQKIANTLK